jgi:predicted transcriptional regulator
MAGKYDESLKEQAREMRRAGMSTAQIAHELGGLPSSTVQSWLAGTPPPEWTSRARAKDSLRKSARALRQQGLTYDEIAAQLRVSKSSISLWVRDLPRPPLRSAGVEARLIGLRRHFEEKRQETAHARRSDKEAWARKTGGLSERELLIAGAVAYWAEGKKSKPWRPQEQVVFVNSDAGMVQTFLCFLALAGVEDDQLRFHIQIHESADVPAAEAYWQQVVGAPPTRFVKTTLKRHTPLTSRKNTGADYHGCVAVRVLRSAALYRRIEGIWWAVRAAGAASLCERSRVV